MSASRIIVDDLAESERIVRVGPGERLQYFIPALHGQPEPRRRRIILEGEGAELQVRGLFLGNTGDTLALTFDIIHAASHTTSHAVFKGALIGKSVFDLDGVIHITKDGHGTDAYLEERALLLSPDARATAVPSLEIEANDVRCKHAAAAGPVDPDILFYLQSRGFSEADAETLMVRGFIDQVVRALPGDWQARVRALLPELSTPHV